MGCEREKGFVHNNFGNCNVSSFDKHLCWDRVPKTLFASRKLNYIMTGFSLTLFSLENHKLGHNTVHSIREPKRIKKCINQSMDFALFLKVLWFISSQRVRNRLLLSVARGPTCVVFEGMPAIIMGRVVFKHGK